MAGDRPGPWFSACVPRYLKFEAALWLKGINAERKVCIECGDMFIPWRKDQVYCHHSCRQRAYRRRHGLVTYP